MNALRKVIQDYNFTRNDDDDFISAFAGLCESREKLNQYLAMDYPLQQEDYIGWEMGIDFSINFYDEDFCILDFIPEPSTDISTVCKESSPEIIEALKKMYPSGLSKQCNSWILLVGINYA